MGKPKEKAEPPPPLTFQMFVPSLMMAVGTVVGMALNAWAEQVTLAAKIVLGLLVCATALATLQVWRFGRERNAWICASIGGVVTAAVLFLFGHEETQVPKLGTQAPGTQQRVLVVHPGDESVIGIKRLDPDEVGRRVYENGTSSFEFLNGPQTATSVPQVGVQPEPESDIEFDVELVSRREGGRLWTQLVKVDRCKKRDGIFHCQLPKGVSWEPRAFVSLSGSDVNGSIVTRRVAAVVPGTGCKPLAGKSLSAGVTMFNAIQRSIAVENFTDATWKEQQPAGEGFFAVAGSYNSWASKELIQSCGHSCGPMLTFSSAQSLRSEIAAPDWVFRMTSSNRRRAADLIPLLTSEFVRLEQERAQLESRCEPPSGNSKQWGERAQLARECEALAEKRPYAQLQIVYNDDRFGTGGVYYAYDQAVELNQALNDKAGIPHPYWVRYGKSGFAAADPLMSDPPPKHARLGVTGFDQLVPQLRARARHSIVVFIALDEDILAFGRAIRSSSKDGSGNLSWYVPAPREPFEGAWEDCLDSPAVLDVLEGVRVVGPDDNNTSVKAWEFAELWSHSEFREQRAPSRAARMYDALQIINLAVSKLDARLPSDLDSVPAKRKGDRLSFMHLDLYRARLRAEIQHTTFYGASGTFAFDEHGDMLSGSFVTELRGKRLQPIAVRGQQPPAPARTQSADATQPGASALSAQPAFAAPARGRLPRKSQYVGPRSN